MVCKLYLSLEFSNFRDSKFNERNKRWSHAGNIVGCSQHWIGDMDT